MRSPRTVRQGLRLACVLGATAVQVLPAAAQDVSTQNQIVAVPVFDLPRPAYSPPGLMLGSFRVAPSASESAEYNDNIFATMTDPVGDYINTTSEDLQVQSQWSRHELDAHLFGSQQVFDAHPSEDANTFGAETIGRLDVTAASALDLDASFIQQPLARNAAEASPGSAGRPIYNTSTGTFGFVQNLDQWNNLAQATLQKIDYLPSDQQFRDVIRVTGLDRVTYALSDQKSVFLQGSYGTGTYRVDPEERNYSIVGATAGLDVAVTDLIQAEISAGAQRQTFVGNQFQPRLVTVVTGQMTWNVTPLTSVIANADRSVIGTDTFCDLRSLTCQTASGTQIGVSPQLATRVSANNSVVNTITQLTVQHEIWHDLLGSIDAGYQRNDFDFVGLVDDTYSAGTTLRYLLNRNLTLEFSYQYAKRTANLPFDRTYNSGPYDANDFMLTLKAAL